MRKKERAAIVIERLKEAYPDVECTLEYDEAWNVAVERYFGEDGNPIACADGYDEIRREYNEQKRRRCLTGRV